MADPETLSHRRQHPIREREELRAIVLKSPLLSPILANWERIALPDGWLVAGAIAQTVWNHAFGLPPTHGISDIDIVYFDGDDLSEETEAGHAARIGDLFCDLPVRIDVKNEARIHLWYEEKFGTPIRPYVSTRAAIATFPTTATAIGIRPSRHGLEISAPFGLADLMSLVVRANRRQITSEIFEQKVERWRAVWPGLTVESWDRQPG
ncbi:nucleotidyltransferase family protein [Ensifer adhaerens]|uniref:nucleotidyltransferase family protein n=1 Tax=Ensifer adhaerens TaxID=106592 RepID=UPI001CBCC658|nr:nucleotidyltransferase family protein [Ensifer adhaerens]MBZ7922339.1 nucleotidyltransferase family protein [Ensifer adhaerens]UAX90976.1 nucleotidyltransferase family protein [Ensifer adhaerens]UAX98605.1 nucleotidyltransferase family protein [Ensifer adhaerens]UAY05986.1 nucleotidyltransferase family protein [Ensifer adhaerens]